jgi:hypothetical protein
MDRMTQIIDCYLANLIAQSGAIRRIVDEGFSKEAVYDYATRYNDENKTRIIKYIYECM